MFTSSPNESPNKLPSLENGIGKGLSPIRSNPTIEAIIRQALPHNPEYDVDPSFTWTLGDCFLRDLFYSTNALVVPTNSKTSYWSSSPHLIGVRTHKRGSFRTYEVVSVKHLTISEFIKFVELEWDTIFKPVFHGYNPLWVLQTVMTAYGLTKMPREEFNSDLPLITVIFCEDKMLEYLYYFKRIPLKRRLYFFPL